MVECEAVVSDSRRGVTTGDPVRCGLSFDNVRHRHDWSCSLATGLADDHDPLLACHPFQFSRSAHGLHDWDKLPRIGQEVVTDHWDSDGTPTRIVTLKEDTTFEQGVGAKYLKPDGKRSSWASIAWLVPVK